MRHQLIHLATPNFPDTFQLDSEPDDFVFLADTVDNPLDADDPESALADYYKRVGTA